MTCENDVAAVLRRAFPGLKGDGLEHLRAVACQRFFPPGAVVVREEEVGQSFFIIVEGEVEVTKQLEGQTRRLLQRHGSGDFFGEMVLIEASSRTATVRTLTPSTLLEINKDEFETMLAQHPAMALTVMRALTQRLRHADQRAISELSQKNEELARVNRELTEQEQIRSEFLTTVAHELRTPLTSANGYLTLVATGRMDGDQAQHAVSRALRNVKRVVKLVHLTISDHGVGIPADQLDRIFERFRRVNHGGLHLFGGVGLGLPLIKQVVEQHGGTIEVDSEEGQGSTFIVSLPAVS